MTEGNGKQTIQLKLIMEGDSFRVEGIPGNRILAYGMLEMARDVIRQVHERETPAAEVKKSSSLLTLPPGTRLP